jgi:nitrate/TMAO reductase-like tetraheme cytochrome c subunit
MAADSQEMNTQDSHPPVSVKLYKNPISLIGMALAAVAFANILFLFFLDAFSHVSSPYVGILAYMVAPAIMIVGLVMIPVGMIIERRRRLHEVGHPPHFAKFDLNNPAQRSAAAFALSFVVIFALMSAVGSYKAYEFTDSVQFCGQLCHSVMSPEFTAYQQSPHARVGCVECHVGSGASWYVKSKLSGARQVYYTAMGTYPRPIPSPVHNLRPAADTCEQCHWPKKFWGSQLKVFSHYGTDEQNTPRVLRLLIRTGGGDPSTGQAAGGIHWHMNINNHMTYIATDDQRQVIPWVRMEDNKGNVVDFMTKDNPPTQAQLDAGTKRKMDCIDCHNRPSHIYTPPDVSVDRGISAGVIDAGLPFIKAQGVEVLIADYKTHDEAKQAIAEKISKFYAEKYPQIASGKSDSIKNAVAELQRIYSTTFFPTMKVNWKTHPNNIGHMYYPGCFRCHDGNHVSKDGRVISKNCNSCHTLLDQEEGAAHLAQMQTEDFKHPVDIGDLTAVNCNDCHSGGVGP